MHHSAPGNDIRSAVMTSLWQKGQNQCAQRDEGEMGAEARVGQVRLGFQIVQSG